MKLDSKMILLVEDNADDEELTIRALKKNHIGNKVFVVRDGSEALDFLFCEGTYADRDPREMPQVTLLDLKLPKVDGLEVAAPTARRSAHSHFACCDPHLISSNEEKDVVEGYQLGANSYVRKPVDFNEFLEAARQLGLYWLVLNKVPPRK